MDFNPNDKLSQIKGKDYLEVKWRLVWFHADTGANAGYVTIELENDSKAGYARYACIAWNGKGEGWRAHKQYGVEVQVCGKIATATKSEEKKDFGDYAEKAETGAIGRAMAGLGYGTQFAPEFDEGERIVDSPVARQQLQKPAQAQPKPQAKPEQPAQAQTQPKPQERAMSKDELKDAFASLGYRDMAWVTIACQVTGQSRETLAKGFSALDLAKLQKRLKLLQDGEARKQAQQEKKSA